MKSLKMKNACLMDGLLEMELVEKLDARESKEIVQ